MLNTSPLCGDIEAAVHTYGSALYRLSLSMLGNAAEAEDAVQEVFLRYVQKSPTFESPEHEKAWLIRVCTNCCRDALRYRKRHPQGDVSGAPAVIEGTPDTGIMEALMRLPEKYRLVLILHYVEGYTAGDIAKIIRRTPSAAKMRLQKGRKLLEEIYRREYM